MAIAPISRSLSDPGFEHSLESRSAPNMRALERSELQAQLLVLSRNSDVIEVVRNAARSVAQVAHARDLDDVGRSLPDIDPGVLIVDEANTSDLSTTITQLARRFPEAVTVIVGTRDESGELMQLTAAGRIFRFLLMPLSYGPVRLALAAAVAQHVERKAVNRQFAAVPAGSEHSRRKHMVAYLILGATLLGIIGGLWTVTNLLAAKPVTPTAAPTPPAAVPKVDPVQAQLARASRAMSQGSYVEPSSDSALALYRNVLLLDPRNELAQAGIRAIGDEFLQRAEQALVAENLDDAQRSIDLVRGIEVGHPRLAFLDTQLARERERLNLSQRRDAGQRVRKLVSEARSDMQAGNLIGAAAGGAAGGFLEARRLDPNDPNVVQGIRDLNVALADAVRMALSAGDAQRAKAFANAARKLGAGDQLLAAIDRSLAENSRRNVAPPPAPIPIASTPIPSVLTPDRATPSEEGTPGKPGAPATASGDSGSNEVVQAADLPRIKQVMPTYPKVAAEDGTEGYVDLDFIISAEGIPRDLKVRAAVPKRIFDVAALNCLRQWRFEPIMQDGVAVSRRATLRLRFQLR